MNAPIEEVEKFRNCPHHPFDREIDEYENQICGICGQTMKTAEELYQCDDDEFFDDDELQIIDEDLCHKRNDGSCGAAGSEFCEFECSLRNN